MEEGASSMDTKPEAQWALMPPVSEPPVLPPTGVHTVLPGGAPSFLFSSLPPLPHHGPFCDVSSLFVLLYGCL